MKKYSALVLFAFLTAAFAGCGTPLPSDFPNLVPVKITVTDSGTPIDNVAVGLTQSDSGTSYATGGNTDAAGLLEVTTSMATHQAKGCPVGKFKVTLNKKPKYPSEKPQEEINQMTPEQTDAYGKIISKEAKEAKPIIPVKLNSMTTTPIEIDVPDGGKDFDFDISQYK